PKYPDYIMRSPLSRGRDAVVGRVRLAGAIVLFPDVLPEPEYRFFEGQKLGGCRTALGIPPRRDGTPIGVIILTRPTARPFSDKEIELPTTFAHHAVIPIQNLRPFHHAQARTPATAQPGRELQA